jgi:Phage integrase, N-terminal SAM-like domain
MASIDRRPDGQYRTRWREYPGGPQKTKQFRRKKEAEFFLDSIRGDLVHGRYVDPAGGLTPFRDYAEQWRPGQVHRRSTAAQAESYLRLRAYPFLGKRPLDSIRRSEIQAWVKGRSEVLAPGSVELVYRWVAAIFKAAVGDQLIAASPCIRIALPKREDGEVLPLTSAQVQRMADACPDRYRALIVLAAGTGLSSQDFPVPVEQRSHRIDEVGVDRSSADESGGRAWGGRRSGAGRPRLYANNAERQRAYRSRRRTRSSSRSETRGGKPPNGGAPGST